jgi:hypothetical protein
LNEFENRDLTINDFNCPSKKGKKEKDGVSMDDNSFIIYLSPRDIIISRGVRRLVGESVEVLKNLIHALFVLTKLVRV